MTGEEISKMKKVNIVLMGIIIILLLVIIVLLLTNQNKNTTLPKGTQEKENIVNKNRDNDDNDPETEVEEKDEIEEEEIIQNSGISREDAINIALADANVDKTNLVFLTSYIQKYNGEFCYHIKFKIKRNHAPYDYVVNAMSGDIELSVKH